MRRRRLDFCEEAGLPQRIKKNLEEANITPLDAVVSDIMGVSGRKMIVAMIDGVRTPSRLAAAATPSSTD